MYRKIPAGIHLMDGATGTALMAEGMPRNVCSEEWILENPGIISDLQRRYAMAGSEIIYTPTLQANPPALSRHGLAEITENINEKLAAISRAAAPHCLIAGDMTTLRGCLDTSDENNFPRMVAAYRRQLRGLTDGGVDLIAAETLLHPLEAKAVLEAAAHENAPPVMLSFAVKPDGALRSGHEPEAVFRDLETLGAAALGVNCVTASDTLPDVICRLKAAVSMPIICKPNTGRAVNGVRPVDIEAFAGILRECVKSGASLIGGCCGTTPEHIAALKSII